MYGDTERDADMLYAVGMFVPDPFVYLKKGRTNYIVMSDLELDRARSKARHCRVLSLSRIQSQLVAQGIRRPTTTDVIEHLLRRLRIRTVYVPFGFPAGLAFELTKRGFGIRPVNGVAFPERTVKTAAEVKKIVAALTMAEVGLGEAVRILKAARIGRGNRLFYGGMVLTAERLRAAIETAVVRASGLASHTIVACGDQACDPHELGHGPLFAHKPIIIDVFPRSQKTGYFGDITRTVVRGRAPDAVRRLYEAVLDAQRVAMEAIRPGVRAASVHKRVVRHMESLGYRTGMRGGRMEGFFHGTGHGLGLEVHEPPRLSQTSRDTIVAGNVVTVEPGLYYPGIGGVRLEDVVLVTGNGVRVLTKFEKTLEL